MENDHTIEILIADDHELYLDGIKHHFHGSDIYKVVDEAHDGQELVKKASAHKPHIILTDLRMPLLSGAGAIKQLLKHTPKTKCIVLTSYDNDASIIEALESGARGYITKNMPKTELFAAIDHVSKGYPYFCQTTSRKMIRLLNKSSFNPYSDTAGAHFSIIERKIIRLICEERTNQEIADTLNMSMRTVENNRSRLLKKMNVRTTAGMAIYAIKNDLFFIDE